MDEETALAAYLAEVEEQDRLAAFDRIKDLIDARIDEKLAELDRAVRSRP